jgi:hypothetical protein
MCILNINGALFHVLILNDISSEGSDASEQASKACFAKTHTQK